MIRTSCRRRNEAEAKILLRRPETLTQQEKALTWGRTAHFVTSAFQLSLSSQRACIAMFSFCVNFHTITSNSDLWGIRIYRPIWMGFDDLKHIVAYWPMRLTIKHDRESGRNPQHEPAWQMPRIGQFHLKLSSGQTDTHNQTIALLVSQGSCKCFSSLSVQSTKFCSLLFFTVVSVLINKVFIHLFKLIGKRLIGLLSLFSTERNVVIRLLKCVYSSFLFLFYCYFCFLVF